MSVSVHGRTVQKTRIERWMIGVHSYRSVNDLKIFFLIELGQVMFFYELTKSKCFAYSCVRLINHAFNPLPKYVIIFFSSPRKQTTICERPSRWHGAHSSRLAYTRPIKCTSKILFSSHVATVPVRGIAAAMPYDDVIQVRVYYSD